MQTLINPQIDCVFKAILGTEENKALLIHFINAVLVPSSEETIVDVTLLNTINEKEAVTDKVTIVDVMAMDQNGHRYQVEIQMQVSDDLPSRMAYTWSELYRSQLSEGETFSQLQPAISIWLLGKDLLITKLSKASHHCFTLYDSLNKITLTDQCQIHIIELKKVQGGDIKEDIDYWTWLFSQRNGLDIDHLPALITDNQYMRQAVKTIKRFTEKEIDRHLYERRVLFQRVQAGMNNALIKAYTETHNARTEKEQERSERIKIQAERDEAIAEVARLKTIYEKSELES